MIIKHKLWGLIVDNAALRECAQLWINLMRNNTINQINNNLLKKKISSIDKYSTKTNTQIYKTLIKLNLISCISKKKNSIEKCTYILYKSSF